MVAAPDGTERELGSKGATRDTSMNTRGPSARIVIDLTGDEPVSVDRSIRTSGSFDTNDIKLEKLSPVLPTVEATETTGPRLQATKDSPAITSIKDEGDIVMAEVKSEPQPEPFQGMGDVLATAVSHNDGPDEDSSFAEQAHECSATIDGSTDTLVKREKDDGQPAPFSTATIYPQELTHRVRYNNADDEDNDMSGLYAPPPNYGQSDEEIPEPIGYRIADELSSSEEESTFEAPRFKAKAIRAKNAKNWHARENEKRAHTRERKRKILHREPTGPNKRFKKDCLTVVDQKGGNPRSDKVALQQAIGNLVYTHPMHARMGRDPSAQGFLGNESNVIITKKAYGEQAIREAECDPATAKKDWQKLAQAARQFGSGKCKPTNDHKWKLDSIQFPLYHHQMLGVSWMVARELNDDLRGGINADEMGLGKTIQALGTIVSNAPEPENIKDGKRTTLIVVPSSLVRQWKAEIDLFLETNHRGSVHIFKSSDDKTLLDLTFYDIIITTYNEVMRQHPSKKATEKRYKEKYSPEEREQHDKEKEKEQKTQILEELHKQHEGPFYKMDFWRVILDEAHTIKDPSSQTSIACRALEATHRWALTGTPLHNNLTELWPYLSFMKVSWAKGQKGFGKLIGNIGERDNKQQFMVMLEEALQKRTSESRFFGKPPFVIPHCFVEKEIVSLSPEETVIYKFLEKKYELASQPTGSEDDLDEEVTSTSGKNKMSGLQNVPTIILRMRMATVHPYLLESTISKELTQEDIQDMRKELAKLKGQSAVGDIVSSWSPTTASLSIDEKLEKAFAQQGCTLCSFCGCEASNPQIAACKHTFCRECFEEAMANAATPSESKVKCPECGQIIKGLRDVESDTTCDEENTDIESTGSLPPALSGFDPDRLAMFLRFEEMYKSAKAPKRKEAQGEDGKKLGNDFFNLQPRGKKNKSRFFEDADKNYPAEFPASNKTTAIIEAVLKWQNEAPEDKILIFTQFMAENQILGRLLQRKGVRFAYLFGEMPKKAKDRAIDGFKTKPELKVMICSLAVGGVGLNLTCANRVILADPWWNVAVEAQAWCRVFRIGQPKKTYFKTVLMKGTIDVRIADLQDAKLKKIQAMMETNESFSTEQYKKILHSAPSAEEWNALMAPA